MKWNHLPLPGGLYDQHPQLLDDFYTIFSKRNAYEVAQAKKTTNTPQNHAATRRARKRR